MSFIRFSQSRTRRTGLVDPFLRMLAVCVIAGSCAIGVLAQTGKLSFGNGKAAFAPPPGFKTLTAEQLKQLLPTADNRATVIGDTARGSTIAYAFIDINLKQAQLDMFRKYMTEQYTSANPALKWVVNKLDTVGGRDGIRMEFSDDAQMHHISLIGHVDDAHAVMVTYNIPIKELAKLEPAVRASIASIRITP